MGWTLTARDDNPDKIHEEIVAPKVVWLRSGIIETFMIKVEHAGGVVEDVTVYLTQRDHCLKRVA